MRTRATVLGALIGLLAVAAGLGTAEALATLLDAPSPVFAVGTWAIDTAPGDVRTWAIEHFQANNKKVLITGVLATLAVLGAAAGVIGLRSARTAVGMAAVIGAIGVLAVVTVRGVSDPYVVRAFPAVGALIVSTGALAWLLFALTGRSVLPGPAAVPVAFGGPDEARAPSARFRLTDRIPPAPAAGPTAERPAVIVPGRLPGEVDRRAFMQAAGAVGAVAAIGGVIRQAGGSSTDGLGSLPTLPAPASAAGVVSGADFEMAKLSPYFTPNADFYRVDTSIVVPRVDANSWKLKITGMVENPITLTYADILRARMIERDVTLSCVSNEIGGNLVGNARWLGVPIRDVIAAARPRPGADAVKSVSIDGWTCGTPLSALTDPNRDALLAVGMNGVPLPRNHGFPVRMVVPGLYGFVSATKWVTEIEVTRYDAFEAYWTKRGWAVQAPIKTQSRVELPVPYSEIAPGKVTIAGVAWAPHRGISKVEVQIGELEAPWQRATLAKWNNKDTWRQWRLDWDAPLGTQNLAVRATDGTGKTQPEAQTPPIPDGAAGWHNVLSNVLEKPTT